MTKIPRPKENPDGLHQRYSVKKIYGNTDPSALYFVLRVDAGGGDPVHLQACQKAARVYANQIKGHIPQMAQELNRLLDVEEAALANRLASNGESPQEVTEENMMHLGSAPDPSTEGDV